MQGYVNPAHVAEPPCSSCRVRNQMHAPGTPGCLCNSCFGFKTRPPTSNTEMQREAWRKYRRDEEPNKQQTAKKACQGEKQSNPDVIQRFSYQYNPNLSLLCSLTRITDSFPASKTNQGD